MFIFIHFIFIQVRDELNATQLEHIRVDAHISVVRA
jgi:hypothetical protein